VIRAVLMSWLILALAIAVAVAIVPGVDVHGGFFAYLWIALLFGLANLLLGTILRLLTLPLIILTLGLFSLVINALMLILVAWVSSSLNIDGFFAALAAAVLISIVNVIVRFVLDRARVRT
jgi:putative membrane protein